MYVDCEQCLGSTEVIGIDMLKLIAKEEEYCVKCWHCGLSLAVGIE